MQGGCAGIERGRIRQIFIGGKFLFKAVDFWSGTQPGLFQTVHYFGNFSLPDQGLSEYQERITHNCSVKTNLEV